MSENGGECGHFHQPDLESESQSSHLQAVILDEFP